MRQENFKAVKQVFHKRFKNVSKGPLSKFQGGLKKRFRDISRTFHSVFQKCFKDVSRQTFRFFKDVASTIESISRLFCFESLLLHVTHLSYPSRRRACFVFSLCYL